MAAALGKQCVINATEGNEPAAGVPALAKARRDAWGRTGRTAFPHPLIRGDPRAMDHVSARITLGVILEPSRTRIPGSARNAIG